VFAAATVTAAAAAAAALTACVEIDQLALFSVSDPNLKNLQCTSI
jgi:hypothetical protein